MKRIAVLAMCLGLGLAGCSAIPSVDTGSLYLTNLPRHEQPTSLLVLILNYDNGYVDATDAEIEQGWADRIFGSGSIEKETASINDYFKENSHGQFYFEPIKLGENKTGVYSIHLDKNYSDEQDPEASWPYQDYKYDLVAALEPLVEQGLDLKQFQAQGVDNTNFKDTLTAYDEAGQDHRDPQWFATSKIMIVYPGVENEPVDFYPLTAGLDSFTVAAHLNHDSSFGIIAHSLSQALGETVDANFDTYALTEVFNTVHINPFYKIIFGWASPTIVTETSDVTLYPTTSQKYQPVIVRTADDNQYYILENRQPTGFDRLLADFVSDGLVVWRIDRLGCETIHDANRTGITLETVMRVANDFQVRRYVDDEDITANSVDLAKISITYVAQNSNGSIDAKVVFQG